MLAWECAATPQHVCVCACALSHTEPLCFPCVLLQGSSDIENVAEVQKRVLKKRRGRLLNRRTILKSYLFDEDEKRGPPEVRLRLVRCGM